METARIGIIAAFLCVVGFSVILYLFSGGGSKSSNKKAPTNIVLYLSYFGLFAVWAASYFVIIPVPVNLILTSTLIVYIGSHRSLRLLISEAEGGAPSSEKEVLSSGDAYRFPLVGSLALASLFLAFKYFKEIANKLLSFYFCLVGIYTLTSSLSPFMTTFITSTKRRGIKFTLPLIEEIDARFTPAEMVSFVFSSAFSLVYYLVIKHDQDHLMNNVFGICFCVQAVEKISVGSFTNGVILLVGLFFYDIYWVFFSHKQFGTSVMVDVAKNLDGPIKLLFPYSFATYAADGSLLTKPKYSLLGLGDIVIPGLFVALLLRYDAVRGGVVPKMAEKIVFPKPFFNVNIVSYAVGLLLSVGVMYFFNSAQPALLYLVPACVLGSLSVALCKGDFTQLCKYDEEAKAGKEKDGKGKGTSAAAEPKKEK